MTADPRDSAENDVIRWAEVEPGSTICNAVTDVDEFGEQVCGYPRDEDGSCWVGHPAPPEVTAP